MGFLALERLPFGDGFIDPGEPVPVEDGRDYGQMLRLGQIAETGDGASADPVLRKELAEARAELDKLRTPADGPRLVLSEDETTLLAEKGLTGEFSLAELDTALLVASESAVAAAEATGGSDDPDALPEGVTDLGSGWYQLPDDGPKVRGREALAEALKANEQ